MDICKQSVLVTTTVYILIIKQNAALKGLKPHWGRSEQYIFQYIGSSYPLRTKCAQSSSISKWIVPLKTCDSEGVDRHVDIPDNKCEYIRS